MSVLKMGFVCYPESLAESIDLTFQKLLLKGNVESYCYILHDNDFEINGELKKAHYHVFIEFKKQQNPNTICKSFNIDKACTINVNNRDGYLAYFVHKYDLEKTQYDVSNVISYNLDFMKCIERCENVKSNEDPIKLMFEMRFSGSGMRELLMFSLDYGYLDIYRRYYTILKECVYFD